MQNFNWHQLQNGSDIRGVALDGVAGEAINLTPEATTMLGKAFVSWLAEQVNKPAADLVISIGRDSRLSGPDLKQGLISGITAMGSRGYDFELASTPAMFMSTVTDGFNCDGAIMLTASHLPFNRNGLKFFTTQGGLGKPDISAILALAEADAFTTAAQAGTVEPRDFMGVYAQQLVQTIRKGVDHPQQYEQPLQGLKIVVDAGNGAGGFFAEHVLQPLGADTTGSQFLEPDGTFPNHIPNPEDGDAIASLKKAVTTHNADFGIIFDTDVDRSGAVDHTGQELNRNRLIALMSAIVLKEHPGSSIVTDSITSDGLTQFIEQQLGGQHHRFKRGYKNVINEAIRLNQSGQDAWLAIETSGHGAMKANYFLDDGAYLISQLLIELAKAKQSGQALSDLISTLQEPTESQELRIEITADDFKACGNQVIEKLQAFAAQQADWTLVPNNYEGVRIACTSPSEAGWFLLRLSLHDPVLPLNIESNVTGGVAQIALRLMACLQKFESLDIPPIT
ncbi:Phosphomannomutase/phosphoglucomutase [Acaryochloris thomasi RCC1774]|uniref:Phosphomannomutase/phosphoglucomutase n=1 Tax=Acaryochloris thomasi RCC1774 TaxID=1764569 RepID=A0A2W1JMK2_9CYAN|nr:phosphomannomutase/phosphoglucomutase [Acaryochloris thomasi]PZD74519.1 Phosphomannomutase/phosphoglucomutase [Acaryochloris thomasi RCC1774]